MRILISCGGTSGHINPAIAIANELKLRDPKTEILFIGTEHKPEADLIPRAGFNMKHISITGLDRRKNLSALKHNFITLKKFIKAKGDVKKCIRDFKPDVAVGTGGYVSAPVISTACKMGVRSVIHEQNAFAGITTQMLAKNVDKILLGFNLAKPLNISKDKVLVVGNPVRQEFLTLSRSVARKSLGISESEVVVLSYGGSLGASGINDAFCAMAKLSLNENLITHFHGATKGYDKLINDLGEYSKNPKIKLYDYIYNIPEIMAAADLIVSRSGAATLSELAALGRASVLIPSPNVTENHQYYNAKTFADAGAAVLLEEKDLTGEKLFEIITNIVFDKEKLRKMEHAAKTFYNKDTLKRICDVISEH